MRDPDSLQRLAAMREITLAITSTLDLRSILDVLLQKINMLLPYSVGFIWLLRDGERLDRFSTEDLGELTGKTLDEIPELTRHVIETRQPLVLTNLQSDSRVLNRDFLRTHGLVSYLGIPMLAKGTVVGSMCFMTRTEHLFTEEEVKDLTMLAGQTAIAIHNSQLYERLEKRTREIAALYDVTATASDSLNLEAVLEAVIKKVTDVFAFDAARIYLADSQRHHLALRASWDVLPEFREKPKTFLLGRGIVGRVAQTGESHVFEDIETDPRYWAMTETKMASKRDCHFLAVFPIKRQHATLGAVVCVGRDPRQLDASQIELITSMARQIAVAVENTNLFSEVNRKAAELESLNREISAANRAKSDFIAAMSHELRTPLHVITGYISMLHEGFKGGINPEQIKILDVIQHQCMILLRMIDNVLTFAKVGAKKLVLDVSTLPLEETLNHVRDYAEQLNRDGKLAIRWNVETTLPSLTTDQTKLEETLQNLIDNAYKFTSKGSIQISVRNLEAQRRVEFTVRDTGHGIQPEEREQIFEMFHQGHESHTGPRSGVGLGLSIIKEYMQLMKGTIDVDSQPGAGAAFRFTLPYTLESQRNTPSRPPTPRRTKTDAS